MPATHTFYPRTTIISGAMYLLSETPPTSEGPIISPAFFMSDQPSWGWSFSNGNALNKNGIAAASNSAGVKVGATYPTHRTEGPVSFQIDWTINYVWDSHVVHTDTYSSVRTDLLDFDETISSTFTPSQYISAGAPEIVISVQASVSNLSGLFGWTDIRFKFFTESGSSRWQTQLFNQFNTGWTETLNISDSWSRQVTTNTGWAEVLNIADNWGASAAGLNTLFFCDISGDEPNWTLHDAGGTSLAVMETPERKRILTLGCQGGIKRLFEVGQRPFTVDEGVIDRDYIGPALTLRAQHDMMYGNTTDDTLKHWISIDMAIDGYRSGFTVWIFLDGDTSNPIQLYPVNMGNGFYRFFIGKYARRIQRRVYFDDLDYPQSIRQEVVTYRPITKLAWPKQVQ